ncbi:MAG: glycosyl transferase family 1 [Rhodospirillaceae bacterium]|nr:glycosyl transferase family 1 [Rhodospirillaceae bacterium]|tara:strand:+ start:30482 stop:31801 length:1320 start_codon:yes stop_codon:yes gene_type:complete
MAKNPTPASGNLPGDMQVEPAPRKFAIAIAYSRTPLPMTRADQMTVAHLISFLSARGHGVDLYGLDTGEPMTDEQDAWLKEHCRKVDLKPHGVFRSAIGALRGLFKGYPLQVGWFLNGAQSAAIAEGLADVDLAYSYYIRSAETMRAVYPTKPSFVAMQLSQSLNTRRMVAHYRNLKEKLLYAVESRLVRSYEARVWRDFSRTVLIGEQDVAEIRAICREKNLPEIDNVFFGPHGTDISRFAPREEVSPVPCSLVFNGVLRTYTNVHAITWFAEFVWPLVKEAEPDATLMIVGRDPRPEVVALGEMDGVTVTGEVENPADYISRAAICIDPVQAGAGMQNKMVEFMAMGKPIVATTVANEGIGAQPGDHVILADEPDEMAKEILALFSDPARAAAVGSAARKFVEQHWTWEAHFLRLEEEMLMAIDELADKNEPSAISD